jgi:predicted lactoylglutathione lyase
VATRISVNSPIRNLSRSIEVFRQLGSTFDSQFTDQNVTSMIVGEDMFVLPPVKRICKTFTKREVLDTSRNTEVIVRGNLDG